MWKCLNVLEFVFGVVVVGFGCFGENLKICGGFLNLFFDKLGLIR